MRLIYMLACCLLASASAQVLTVLKTGSTPDGNIVGILRNDNAYPIRTGPVQVALFGADGQPLDVLTTYPPLSILNPGEESPFATSTRLNYSTYRTTAAAQRSEVGVERPFSIAGFETARPDGRSTYCDFSANIRNRSANSFEWIRLYVVGLDAQGRPLTLDRFEPKQQRLLAGVVASATGSRACGFRVTGLEIVSPLPVTEYRFYVDGSRVGS